MTDGTKDYFRHSFHALKDVELRAFMNQFGRNWREGYFYYFSLLEYCASIAEPSQIDFKIHIDDLRNLWGTNTKGVQSVCKVFANSALLVCKPCTNFDQTLIKHCANFDQTLRKHCANYVFFSIPNLPKYFGSYPLNERKGNKRKEKEIKLNNKQERCIAEFSNLGAVSDLLCDVPINIQQQWISDYGSVDFVGNELQKACSWISEKGTLPMHLSNFFTRWLHNAKTKMKINRDNSTSKNPFYDDLVQGVGNE
jgi:hypothetical protein